MKPYLAFDPVIPLPQAIGIALIAVGLAIWLYRIAIRSETGSRRALYALAVIRAVVIGALALFLLNPVWTLADQERGKPPVLIVVDSSESMAVPDVNGERRFDVARKSALDPELLTALGIRHTPILFSLSESATRAEASALRRTPGPTGASTHLGEGIAAAISASEGPSGALLLLSDGRNNGELDPVQVARQARARRFPIFTVALGTQKQGQDVMLLNRRPQVYAAPAQEVSLMAEARSIGFHGQHADARLLKDGKPVSSKRIQLDDRRPTQVSFSVTEPKPGNYRYGIAIDPLPKEGTDANNRCSVVLQVQDAKARVLVLEGRPTWDAKFMIQALHTDPNIEIDAIYKLADQKFFAVKGAVEPGALPTQAVKIPSTAAELAKYDVVIVGKGYDEFHDEKSTAELKKFVSDHAGSLIFLRGKAAERGSALEALEPVRWSDEQVRDFRVQVTEEGIRHPAFSFRAAADARSIVQKLPRLISATRVEEEKALSVVLARASEVTSGEQQKEMAVLAYQNYGQGKVVALIGQGLWRWAFLPPDLKEFAGCYNDFWTQLIRWLVNQSDFLPGQEVTLKTNKASYSLGETVHLMAFVRGQAKMEIPPVKITAPDGKSTGLRLGKVGGSQADLAASYKPRDVGEYMATLPRPGGGSLFVPFSVYPDKEEAIITAADPVLMRQIAEAGGGEALTPSQLVDLPGKLQEARAMLTTRHETRSAWDQSWVLAILLGALSLEWILRRRWGLV